ncbi:hypothetical protein Zmor_024090 [Zophobas morio]|uniref:Uncharacterized protein n=1 Tax=Zophobas morio TaxID=2755281 RepID=A0AA38M764_9CUCU|nr:hypothetical protein Zmor_024090 [Zophobas morio]
MNPFHPCQCNVTKRIFAGRKSRQVPIAGGKFAIAAPTWPEKGFFLEVFMKEGVLWPFSPKGVGCEKYRAPVRTDHRKYNLGFVPISNWFLNHRLPAKNRTAITIFFFFVIAKDSRSNPS